MLLTIYVIANITATVDDMTFDVTDVT